MQGKYIKKVIIITVFIIFGIYPANKAAKLNSVDALRYEYFFNGMKLSYFVKKII